MPYIIGDKVKPEGHDGGMTIEKNGEIITRFSHEYYILVENDNFNSIDVILLTPNLPLPGDIHLNGTPCVGISAREDSTHANLWIARAEFDSSKEPPEEDDPTEWRPKWRWNYETQEELLEYDAIEGKDKPIVNTVEEPLLVLAPVVIAILTVERYQLTFDPDVIVDYANHVNTTPFWGAPKHCALMSGIQDDPETITIREHKFEVRKCQYNIKFKIKKVQGSMQEGGWDLELLNHGTRHMTGHAGRFGDPAAPIYLQFTDEHKNPTTGNLGLDGKPLKWGQQPVYLKFNRHPEANLNQLQLGPF